MKIYGYTTTRNCINMSYPFEESILNHLDFCDHVVVVDTSDGSDATVERLDNLVNQVNQVGADRLSVYHLDADYNVPNFPLLDGRTKALARSLCKNADYLWQFDVDEAVMPGSRKAIESFINMCFTENSYDVFTLPVVEFWGSSVDEKGHAKVRVDVNPWKERVSRNNVQVIHGAPANKMKHEKSVEDGRYYDFMCPGTDGCNYISSDQHQLVPVGHAYMTNEVEDCRRAALNGDELSLKVYQAWLNKLIEDSAVPVVFHYSWWSVYHKMLGYEKYWNKFWLAAYNEKRPEGWNPFSDKPLNEMTDQEKRELATRLETETGGHIFHTQWKGQKTPHANVTCQGPEDMVKWYVNRNELSSAKDSD